MTPGDPLSDMSVERIKLLLERDYITLAAKQQLCVLQDFELVRAFRLLQGGMNPGHEELTRYGVNSQGDADLVLDVMREADNLAREAGQ